MNADDLSEPGGREYKRKHAGDYARAPPFIFAVLPEQPAEPQAERPRQKPVTIGTVCKALRQEFPDISISKIRYLEDQKLLTPRRTPGGYRLYSAGDVQRLQGKIDELERVFEGLSSKIAELQKREAPLPSAQPPPN